MVLRIWTLLLAVLLLAAPAETAFAEADAPSESATACDELVVLVALPLPAATPARVPIAGPETPLPSAPSDARVFRPPEPVVR